MPAHRFLWLLICVSLHACTAAEEGQTATTVRLTDKVLVRDCSRFGINLGGDNYYSGSVLLKQRAVANFEGSTYRQAHFGPIWDERGASTWFGMSEDWRQVFAGSRYVILSGPSQWTSGTLRDIVKVPFNHRGQDIQQDMFVFDRAIQPVPGGGVMLEADRLDEGYIGKPDKYWRVNLSPQAGDVPPGSAGRVACRMDASRDPALIRFGTHYHQFGALNGMWNIQFWAKAVAGRPELTVSPDSRKWGESAQVKPGPAWQKYEFRLPVKGVPEPGPSAKNVHLLWVIKASGGEALIDDVEIRLEGDENPTAFRDDLVATLKKLNPGHLRYLQMGGNTLRNTLLPPLQAHAFTSRLGARPGPFASKNRTPYGLHQFYELCRYLEADPWYCLPGTMNREEIVQFMEYLGGDENTDFGRLRIAMGQKQPWTEVFKQIHIEFGNEAWNNAPHYKVGGFNGPDYWRSLIATAKASPYYRSNLLFHAAGQASSASRNRAIMKNTPNADRFSVAPYLISTLTKEDMALLDTDDKFFRWAFAWPVQRSMDKDGVMFRNQQLAKESGQELSVYEINHHTTSGDAPLEPRNTLVTSLGGGLNVINNMLLMLREHHLRTQSLFSLIQHSYRARDIGQVRLWGTALNMRAGQERYRPTFLAAAAVNQVIAGNLVETVHQGAKPVFAATGVFKKSDGVQTLRSIPALWSYGFSDGNKRGLIVINLDTAKPHEIAVDFTGTPAGPAKKQLLSAESITANNEFEQSEPQVVIREESIENFNSGTVISIPPHSMLTLSWSVNR